MLARTIQVVGLYAVTDFSVLLTMFRRDINVHERALGGQELGLVELVLVGRLWREQ